MGQTRPCQFLAAEAQEAWTLHRQLFAVPCIQMAGQSKIEKNFTPLNCKTPGTYALKIHTWNKNDA